MLDWMTQAECTQTDPEIFFGDDTKLARSICAGCPVTAQCADYGRSDAFGIFGGLDPSEREPVAQRVTRSRPVDPAAAEAKAARVASKAAVMARIRQLASEGLTAYQIIKATGFARATVYRVVREEVAA